MEGNRSGIANNNEVDSFLDQVMVEKSGLKAPAIISTSAKNSGISSPLPASVPKAPRAMLALPAARSQSPAILHVGSNQPIFTPGLLPFRSDSKDHTLQKKGGSPYLF